MTKPDSKSDLKSGSEADRKPEPLILNSFVRRTENTTDLKALIKATGANVSRKGRSRNWLLLATQAQQQQIIEQLNQTEQISWLWLGKLLIENRPPVTVADLLAIIKSNPAITVKQLMGLTDCTIGEARIALDEAEFL